MEVLINCCNILGILKKQHTLLDHKRKLQACKYPGLFVTLLSEDTSERESGSMMPAEVWTSAGWWDNEWVNPIVLPQKSSHWSCPTRNPQCQVHTQRDKCEHLVVFLKQAMCYVGWLWYGREKQDARHLGHSHWCSNASPGSFPDSFYFNSTAKSERKVLMYFWQSNCIKRALHSTTFR